MKRITSFARVILPVLLGIFFLFSNDTFAQGKRIDKYLISKTDIPYTTIVNQGAQNRGGSGAYYIAPYGWALPFNFMYDGVTYTAGTAWYQNVGNIGVSSNYTYYYNFITNPSYPASSYPNYIAPLQGLHVADNTTNTTGYLGGVYYLLTGTAPNRVMTFEWHKYGDYPSRSLGVTSYQLKVYETSYMLEFIYEKNSFQIMNSSYVGSYYPGVGLNGTGGLQVKLYGTTSEYYTPSTDFRLQFLPNVQMSTTPKQLNYGPILQGNFLDLPVRVTHVGTEGVLNILTATITGPNASDFTIVSPTTPPAGIPVGGYVDYIIRFSPTYFGDRTATLTITSNGVDSAIQTISLVAYGIAPLISVEPTVLFRGKFVPIDDSAEQSIVIYSTSDAALSFPLYPNSFVFTGDGASDYVVSRLPAATIPGHSQDTLKVKFKPRMEGGRPAVLTINNNSANNPAVNISLRAIGTIPRLQITPQEVVHFDSVDLSTGAEVCKEIELYNPGSADLKINDIYFASNDGDFRLQLPLGWNKIVKPLATEKIQLCFKPLQKGTRQARLRILTNIPLTIEDGEPVGEGQGNSIIRRDTSSEDLIVWANAYGYGNLAAAASTLDTVVINTPFCRQDTLRNTGVAPLVVTQLQMMGPDASKYQVSGIQTPLTIPAGGMAPYTVCITPDAVRTYTGNLRAWAVSDDRTMNVMTSYTTVCVLTKPIITPGKLFDGAEVEIGTSLTADVLVKNTNKVPMTFDAVLLKGEGYTLGASHFTLAAGESRLVPVTFAPLTSGEASGTLRISSANTEDIFITLNGIGVPKQDVMSGVAQTTSNGYTLEQNYPNPAGQLTEFNVTVPATTTVRITLSDVTGKMVREIANTRLEAGKHSFNVDTRGLTAGTYIYTLESGSVRIARQMIIAK
jgi:hypothetical protein